MRRRRSPDRGDRGPRPRRRRPRLAPWLLLVAGVGLSVGGFAARERTIADDQRRTFLDETDAVVASLRDTVAGYESVLRGIKGEFADGQAVTREEYDAYVKSLLLPTRFPGVFGTAWTYNVPSDEVQAFLEAGGVDPPPEPDLAPGARFEASFIITHAAPDETIGIARGVDARLFPEIATVLEEARDSGAIRMGPRFQIPVRHAVESTDQLPVVFSLVLPLYRGGSTPVTVEDRRSEIVGWAGIMVEGKPFLATGAGEFAPRYKIEIYDGEKVADSALVARSRTKADSRGATRQLTFALYDRQWTIRLQQVRAPEDSTPLSLALLSGGVVVTLLVFGLMLVISRSEARALKMVDRATEELSAQERHFRALVANSSDLIVVTDGKAVATYVSPSVRRMLGYHEDDVVGADLTALVHADDLPHLQGELRDHLAGDELVGPIDFRMRHADGGWRYLQAIGVNLLDDPAVGGMVFNCRDVTERRAFEENLALQATHDPLTGLPNRTLLLDRLEQALARAERSDAGPAVLFVDLDRFKLVNDSFGHGAGDDLLIEVAERLRQAVRPGDTVARFGGDEFVVLAEGVCDEEECNVIAGRLMATLASPILLGGHEIYATASVGISLSVDGSQTADHLLRDADAAMYQAKQQGRARVVIFDEATRRESADRLATESALRRALERAEFVLHYQPVVDLTSGSMIGAEALLRWQHPERGLIGPDQFIELAEDSGLIVPLGSWVVREACRQGYRWLQRGEPGRSFAVSVNLSARELAEPTLVESVAQALRESGLPPEALCVEIGETALMHDIAHTATVLDSLKALGVRLVIDDFGTGYASLGHLKRLPVDGLKIDRAFVDGLGRDPDDTVIAAAVIGLAHALGVTAVAEGVETEAQLRELGALRCDAAQGYLFAHPAEASAIDTIAGTLHSFDVAGTDSPRTPS